MKYDVFISHSSKDVQEVSKIVEFLEHKGFVCFVSYRDIPHCEDWADYLITALEQSRSVVYVHTESANNSTQIIREIQISVDDLKKPFVTYRLCDEPFKGGKKYFLQTLNWIDSIGDTTRSLPLLEKTLRSVIENAEPLGYNALDESGQISRGKWQRLHFFKAKLFVGIVLPIILVCSIFAIVFFVSEHKKEVVRNDESLYSVLLQNAKADMAGLKNPENAFKRLDSAAVIAARYDRTKYRDNFSADIAELETAYKSNLSESLSPLMDQIVQWYNIYDLMPGEELKSNILMNIEKVQNINEILGQVDSTVILEIKKTLQNE